VIDRLTTCGLAVASLVIACGGGGATSNGTSTSASAGGGGAGAGGQGGSGAAVGDSIPDAACTAPPTAGVELFSATDDVSLSQLVAVGDGWAALGESGVVFLDNTAMSAEAPIALAPGAHLGLGGESALTVAARGVQSLIVQRYGPSGTPLGGPTGMAVENIGDLTMAGPSGPTMVWASNTRLIARTLDGSGGFATDPFDLVTAAFSTYAHVASAARGPVRALAWTGDALPGAFETFFILHAGTTAPEEEPRKILATITSHELVDMVDSDGGWVLLITGEAPARNPTLIRLNDQGFPVGEPLPVDNGRYAFDMAAGATTFGMAMGRQNDDPRVDIDHPTLRIVHQDLMSSLAPICLGDDYDITAPPAVAASGDDYATIHTTDSGAVIFHRFSAADLGL
jgi:hypothetical protein